jgi:predicted negative regulator of RcsB-dependent stress response
MALEWLKAGFRGRQYTKAIDQLQAQLAKRRSDPRLKLQLAELLIQAKRPGEALPFLESVADDFALQGFASRS